MERTLCTKGMNDSTSNTRSRERNLQTESILANSVSARQQELMRRKQSGNSAHARGLRAAVDSQRIARNTRLSMFPNGRHAPELPPLPLSASRHVRGERNGAEKTWRVRRKCDKCKTNDAHTLFHVFPRDRKQGGPQKSAILWPQNWSQKGEGRLSALTV